MKVLIVEDDPTNRFIANRLFPFDFEISNTKNSSEAIEIFKNEDFSAILIDLKLGPESLSGEQLMQELRQSEKGKAVKIIAVSSYYMPEEAGIFIKAGKEKMVESIKGLIAS